MFEPQVRKGVEHALSRAVRWSVGDDVMYTVNVAVYVALEDAASDVLGDVQEDAAQWDLEHSSLEIFSEEAQ